jgi:hypothetical protein
MYQTAVSRLCTTSHGSHVRKVARLLARPLNSLPQTPQACPSANLTATFSEDMKGSSINSTTFSAVREGHNDEGWGHD